MSRPLRILVTGSREWTDRGVIERALADVIAENPGRTPKVLVHGGCPTGADQLADEIWRGWRVPGGSSEPEVHPADWGRYGKAAGPRRNAEMVQLGADICLAFPLGESRGTRGCIDLAEKAGAPVRVFEGVAR